MYLKKRNFRINNMAIFGLIILNFDCKGVSGAELVAKLVESESSVSSDTGIIALLQMPPPLVDISSTKLERDTSSDVLSPAFKSKRWVLVTDQYFHL